MNKILSKEHFSEKVVKLVVEAPLIAKARRPGHFVIVICDEKGERIPLTIADADVKKGTITLVVQAIGDSTAQICAKEPGEYLHDVVGPLGRATDIRNYGTVVPPESEPLPVLDVPAYTVLIQFIRLPDQPVMGQRHRPHIRPPDFLFLIGHPQRGPGKTPSCVKEFSPIHIFLSRISRAIPAILRQYKFGRKKPRT